MMQPSETVEMQEMAQPSGQQRDVEARVQSAPASWFFFRFVLCRTLSHRKTKKVSVFLLEFKCSKLLEKLLSYQHAFIMFRLLKKKN